VVEVSISDKKKPCKHEECRAKIKTET